MTRSIACAVFISSILLNLVAGNVALSRADEHAPKSKIIFSSQRTANYSSSIFSIHPDGTNQQQLSFHDDGTPSSLDPGPSADGKKILFTRGGGGAHRVAVWQLDIESQSESGLTGNVMVRFNRGRAWTSPRPNHEQYIYVKEEAGTRNLTLASYGDSPEVDLGPGEFPCWSPDGSQLAYVRSEETGPRIWVVTIGKDDAHPITDPSLVVSHPSWSPITNRIIATGLAGEKNDLFVIAQDGSAPVNITKTTDRSESFASWSPDERHVAYVARSANPADGFQQSVYVLDLATGEANEITTGEFHDSRPTWVRVESP